MGNIGRDEELEELILYPEDEPGERTEQVPQTEPVKVPQTKPVEVPA